LFLNGSRVLLIIEQAGRDAGNRFSPEMWEFLMKIVLGVTDYLLSDPVDEPNQLSTKLCPLLLKVLFQIWFRSGRMTDILWKRLVAL
jgi:hypothetical protein